MENAFYGWFDDASQGGKPTYNPPADSAPCPACGRKITLDDVRTHSLMPKESYVPRSYFYRTHRTCAEKHGDEAMDDFILDMIKRNGD